MIESQLGATARLLNRAQFGDRLSRDELATKHLPLLRRLAHGRLGAAATPELAEEIARETLRRALSQKRRSPPVHDGAFLVELRDRMDEVVADVQSRTPPAATAAPMDAELGAGTCERYRQALDALPAAERTAAILSIEFAQDASAVAALLELPSAAEATALLERAAGATGTGDLERIRSFFAASRQGADGAAPPVLPGLVLQEQIGEGAFGRIYRAHDEKLARDVAVKVFTRNPTESQSMAERREQFIREARTLARVDHPNVLRVHSVVEHEGQTALVTELVDGKPLDVVYREIGVLGVGELVQIGVQMAQALAAVHAAGIIHRDVKPANIMRDALGRYLLMDFGEGVMFGRDGGAPGAGEITGTPLFMSPEQARGMDVDPRTDLFSLGVVLYLLATGKPPYPFEEGTDVEDAMQMILGNRVVPLRDRRPDLPAALVAVVNRLLAAKPADRFASAGEVEHALLATLSSSFVERVGRRHWLRMIGIGLGIAALLTVAIIWYESLIPFRVEVCKIVGDDVVQLADPANELAPGDKFYLEVFSRRQIYLYVLRRSVDGTREILFPSPASVLTNPISSETIHRLPEKTGHVWQMDAKSGDTVIIDVIGSEQPYIKLENAFKIRAEPTSGSVASVPVGDKTPTAKVLDEVIEELQRAESGSQFGIDRWYIEVRCRLQ